MIDAARLVQAVQAEAGLASAEEARRLLSKVVSSLGRSLPPEGLAELRQALPAELSSALARVPAEQDPLMEPETFVGPLVNDLETESLYDQSYGGLDLVSVYADDDANRQVQAALQALRRALPPGRLDALLDQTPEGLRGWLLRGNR